jgi:hypothetical protein
MKRRDRPGASVWLGGELARSLRNAPPLGSCDADSDLETTASAAIGQVRLSNRRRITKTVNPIQIQTFLKGVDYPASKEDLLASAERNGADEDVRATLEQLPDDEYDTSPT